MNKVFVFFNKRNSLFFSLQKRINWDGRVCGFFPWFMFCSIIPHFLCTLWSPIIAPISWSVALLIPSHLVHFLCMCVADTPHPIWLQWALFLLLFTYPEFPCTKRPSTWIIITSIVLYLYLFLLACLVGFYASCWNEHWCIHFF